MADPLGNGFRCHSLYCSLIFFISFPSLFPYLFMMFAVIGSGLSGHAAEILISFLFPSCLFFLTSLSFAHLLCLSVSHSLSSPPPSPPSLVPETLVLTHSPPVWHFPSPFLYSAFFSMPCESFHRTFYPLQCFFMSVSSLLTDSVYTDASL